MLNLSNGNPRKTITQIDAYLFVDTSGKPAPRLTFPQKLKIKNTFLTII